MKKISFNDDWNFKTSERQLNGVTLPFDAQLLDGRSADSPGGGGHGYFLGNTYEYEKHFLAPLKWKDNHVQILFEGVYRNCEVFLNGKKLGEHCYGYTQFTVDLDDVLECGAENTLKVNVDNSKLPNSRWYTGGGIYRPVSLLIGGKDHIAFQGVKVTTLEINPARIRVEVDANCDCNINVDILKDGKVVAKTNGHDSEIVIENAKVWSDDTPELYEAVVTLEKDGQIVDEAVEKFGIRKITWSNQGLFVNGVNTLLRGGCVHHDNGIIGAASLPESEWRRVRILKEQGFNAIRVSHNPASTAMLEACDYYGMYVMDEAFDMWYVRKTKYDYGMDFKDCWQSDVQAMVERDYNHPAVIMYSIGNEVSEPGKPEGVDQGKEIISFIKGMDDTRAVTGGMNLMIMSNYAKGKGLYDNLDKEQTAVQADDGKTKNASLFFNMMASFVGPGMNKAGNSNKVDAVTTPILDALDIAGYNYANGRYPMEGQKHPDRVVVGSETFPYEIGKNWDMVRKYPYLIGDFMWTAWDYLGEAGLGAWSYTGGMPFNRPYPWILAGAGVIDILGNPDASAGLAKVVWHVIDTPVIGVRPVNHPGVRVSKSVWRGTNAIESWSWKGCEGNKVEVEIFADAAEVELFINGKSLGKKKIKNYQTMYKTKYQPGIIEAVSYDKYGNAIGKSALKSAGDAQVVVFPEKENYRIGDIAYFDISIRDKDGIVESNSDRTLNVAVQGGELLGFGSANPCTKEDYLSGTFTTYYGRAQAIVRVTSDDVKLVIK